MPGRRGATRGALRLVFDRQFGSLFWGKLFSGVGIWAHSIVAAVVVFEATGSALWVGLVSIVQFAPQVFLTPLSGTWADRGGFTRQIVLGRLLCLSGSGFLALFCSTREDLDGSGDATVVLCATVVTGLGFVVGGPAQQSVVPLLVRRSEFPTAMALNSLPMTLSRVVGPAAGSFVAAVYHPGIAFGLAAGTHGVCIVTTLIANLPRGQQGGSDADYSVRTGIDYVLADRSMMMLLIVVAAVGFGSDPSITLAPTIAEALGGGTQLVGQLTGAFGGGAFLGFFGYRILVLVLRQARVLQAGLVGLGFGIAFVAAAPTAAAALMAFVVAGAGFMLASTSALTLVQERVPDELRGRVMALWLVAFVGSRPIAAGLGGYLTDAVSLQVALVVSACVVLAALAVIRPTVLDASK